MASDGEDVGSHVLLIFSPPSLFSLSVLLCGPGSLNSWI